MKNIYKISWLDFFLIEKKKEYFLYLLNKIKNIRRNTIVYPKKNMVFNAFLFTPLSSIKVVILGQDPYHSAGQAHGLSFSVPKGVFLPPSLKNIFIELKNNFSFYKKNIHGCLESWAKQGVFLLNSILTVSKGIPNSHKNLGWEIFTDQVIKFISDICKGVVFLLWGNISQKKYYLIDSKKHFILRSTHPSPLSCYKGFFGCNHFFKTNVLLQNQKKKPINWFLDLFE
ncbi:uracil-DNA glycosylase [Buchnera aphidicola]|uniref:Uracil-DNA glycosylase n=1 Tax=Buchnera aphidicola subsp. Cinara cedri (strain Cc) TaxID=372461 RepID=UNG_BUCCC|nr:uracil-DNA glycosylase [Buchnera aphidicola]Q057V4.1 RecName: Full=Uracil-DNA glycosylase; Short=UDG [Buchnera aphidicola BCc]ABJ90595.1 uracil-DNA glycosylase [Buchnera aphidicola BCc]